MARECVAGAELSETFRTEVAGRALTLSVRLLGADVALAISGGDRPHIGSVAIAEPRPSLADAAWAQGKFGQLEAARSRLDEAFEALAAQP